MKTVVDRDECSIGVDVLNHKRPVFIGIEAGESAIGGRISHDEAIHLAAALVDSSLTRCSPELREKFYQLIKDIFQT